VAEPAPVSSTAPVNGDGKSPTLMAPVNQFRQTETLSRLQAHLTTTARAWDRLPPIFSNRSGSAARIELWVKARLKNFSRWFTWEQVNFNAAVHHALGEALEALGRHEAVIAAVRAQLSQTDNENRVLRDEVQSQRGVIEAQAAELNSLRERLEAEGAARRLDLQNQQKDLSSLRAEMHGELEASSIRAETQQTELSAQQELTAELSRQTFDLRERSSVTESEQRVCYQQLSLELSETAAARDRAQRRTTDALEELNQRIVKLEDSHKRAAKP